MNRFSRAASDSAVRAHWEHAMRREANMAERKSNTTKPTGTAGQADVRITVAEGTCGDGCGAELNKGRSFKQGHDAKLHSVLAKALRDGHTTFQLNDGPVITIVQEYANHNWTVPTPKPAKRSKSAVKDEPTSEQADAAEAAEQSESAEVA